MQNNIYSMGNGSDFELPQEILTVLPTDPYDQLDLARKITSIAIASRVSKLEAETGKLKHRVNEKDQVIYELQDKIAQLEDALQESNRRLCHALDDQLEAFKKTLMQSLHEDDEAPQAEMAETMTAQRPVYAKSSFSSSLREEDVNGALALSNQAASENMDTSSSIREDENHAEADASRHSGQRFSLTPYLTPRRTPTGTPKMVSAAGSPKRSSAAGSPRRHSASGSPTRRQYEGRVQSSSSLPAGHHATAPNSPPHTRSLPARTPRVDGKEFFRQARKPCARQMRYLAQITKIYILHLMDCLAAICLDKNQPPYVSACANICIGYETCV